MTMPATRSELFSQLLDLHLTRSIDRLKGDDVMTDKFRELAKSIRGDMENFNAQADELMGKREELRQRGEKVFTRHREHLDDVKSGIAAMESAVAAMEGGNSKNDQEGSGGTPGSSFSEK